MDSWATPKLPRLTGSGRQLRLFDSSSGVLKAVGPSPTTPAEARMYVCGITPYDAAHLGHAATYLAFDIVNRVWRDAGHSVNYSQNVTDIDDPLLERAQRDNELWSSLASREIDTFRADMAALGILPPRSYVGVVESIAGIVEMVEKLVAAGAGYVLPDGTGDIYFDLKAAPDFGYESRLDYETMLKLFAEHGGDLERVGKRAPLDPLLWRGERPGEPAWDSPLGRGRPGWHIECAVIAVSQLGMGIDVQGGGADLLFPHHEMSAAHAEIAYAERPFARSYVHAGLVGLNGEKMSKSKGNLVFTSTLLAEGVDPAAIRLALLAGHYRTDRPWTSALLRDAQERLARWRAASRLVAGPAAQWVVATMRDRLADDLDTPAAIAAIDEWAGAALATGGDDVTAPNLIVDAAGALLGVKL